MRAFPGINALICLLLLVGGVAPGQAAPLSVPAPVPYTPITPTMADRTITLTGHDLTIEQVLAVARDGAQVRYSPEAIQRAQNGWGLRQEAGAENIQVYGLNR